MGFALNPDIDG